MPPRRPPKYRRRYQAILRAVGETAWAILPEKMDAICELLRMRSSGHIFTAKEVAARIGSKPAQVPGGNRVAVISIFGVIAQRLGMMEQISGGMATEALDRAITEAANDPDIKTIVLNVDSPGGSVFGVAESATLIYEARKKKRIVAVVNSMAASAAYWIASAATEIVITPNGIAGSIGVLSVYTSTERMDKKLGLKTTVFRRPEGKAEGAGGEDLTAAAEKARQKMVDDYYSAFIDAVARHRGVSTTKVQNDYGQGRVFLAKDALSAGMVDRIATLDSVLSELGVGSQASPSAAQSAPAFSLEGFDMDPKVFGALVRIGMCAITATIAEANDALARFFAVQGTAVPATAAEQLTALEAHIAKPGATTTVLSAAAPVQVAQQLAPIVGTLRTQDPDRDATIMNAVRISAVPEASKFALATELINAKGTDGQALSVHAAITRITEQAATGSAPTGATVIAAGPAEREKLVVDARQIILSEMFAGKPPAQIFDRRTQDYVAFKPTMANRRLAKPLGLARACLAHVGYSQQQLADMPNAIIAQLVLGGDPGQFGLVAASDGAAYNVSGMYTNILVDAANVGLRRSYDDARTTFQVWMKRGNSIRDFRPTHRSILGELSDPKAVPENGEFEEQTTTDSKESYTLTVWGGVWSQSWQSIVNDVMGAFTDVGPKQGSAMKRKENRLAYNVLKDNAAMADTGLLFNATAQATAGGHNNLSTGAGAPTVANLNTLTQRMMEMKGVNVAESGALNIMPRFLVTCPALRGTVLELIGSLSNPASTNANVKNIWENGLEAVIEGELGAGAGGSDTAWYLAADTNEAEHIEYAFLEGLEAPVIQMQPSFDRLAIRSRCYHAFGTKAIDYRGVQKHAGA
jgi:signal peptide peptidase SppA